MSVCLYCKRSDRHFGSVEHVIPESLGNQGLSGKPAIVLPRGVVCDTCNHGKLSNLDDALINFTPISLLRTLYGVRSKTGKLPSSKLGNASLQMFAQGTLPSSQTARRHSRTTASAK
jgi:hypothetical protein